MRRPNFNLNIKFPEGYIAPAFIAFSAGIILAANYFISRQDNLYRVDILTSELKGSANGLVSPILLSDLTAIEQAAQVKVESNNTIKCLTISEYLSGQKINLTTILRTSSKGTGPTYSDQIALSTCGNSEANKNQSKYNFISVPITLNNQLLGEIEVLSDKTQNFDGRLFTRYLATSSAILMTSYRNQFIQKNHVSQRKLKEQALNSAPERATLSELTQNIYKAFESKTMVGGNGALTQKNLFIDKNNLCLALETAERTLSSIAQHHRKTGGRTILPATRKSKILSTAKTKSTDQSILIS